MARRVFAYPNDRRGILSHTLHCGSVHAHMVQAAAAFPMKVGLFSERPSLPPEQVIDDGAVLCLIRTSRPALFFKGGRADFRTTLCPALDIVKTIVSYALALLAYALALFSHFQ